MTTLDDAAAVVKLASDADYFGADDDRIVELQERLSAVGQQKDPPDPLLAVGAPAAIQRDQHDEIPVLLANFYTTLRAWQVNPRTNVHLFLRDLTSGVLHVAYPLVSHRRGVRQRPSAAGSPPSDLNGATTNAAVERCNLVERLQPTPIFAGRYVVTATWHELLSNSAAVQISGGPARSGLTWSGPQAYVQAYRDVTPDPGVKVWVRPAAGGSVVVRVAAQVSATSGVLKLGRAGTAEAEACFWPCNVILSRLDETPVIVPALVPVDQAAGGEGGVRQFNAVFDVDLRAALGTSLSGAFQVFVDVGDRFVGPFPLQVDG
jgi:hypothetical protein